MPKAKQTIVITALICAGFMGTCSDALGVEGQKPTMRELLHIYREKMDRIKSYIFETESIYAGRIITLPGGRRIRNEGIAPRTEEIRTDGDRFYICERDPTGLGGSKGVVIPNDSRSRTWLWDGKYYYLGGQSTKQYIRKFAEKHISEELREQYIKRAMGNPMKETVAIALYVTFAAMVSGQESKSLVLRGRVVDSSVRPVAGAEVAAYKKQWICYSGPVWAELLGPVVKTDSEGRFMMEVQAGPEFDFQYNTFIVARKEGLAYAWDGLNYAFNERAEGNFNLILEKPGILSGKLLEADGRPVAEAKVRAVPKNHCLHRLRQRPILGPEEWFTTQTDADGNFTFDYFGADVAADFMVEAPGRSLVHQFTTCYLNGCGYEVEKPQVKLVLPPKTTVQGRVIDAQTGAGVSGVSLMLQVCSVPDSEHLYYHYRFKSREDGSFLIEAVPPGRHILRVVTPKDGTGEWIGKNTLINIKSEETSKAVTVRAQKAGLIRVLVRDEESRQPLSDAQLSLRNAQFTGFAKDWGFYRNAYTRNDGIALIRCPAGRCEVRASRPGYHLGNPMPVTVREGATVTREIYLEQKDRVTGTVTDESGRPVEGAFVAVHPHGDEAFTDGSGSFALKPERTGRKPEVLFARHVDRNLAAAVHIEDPTEPLRVALKPAVSVVGKVTDTAGNGIPAARVSLTTGISNALSKFTEVIADQAGSYEIKAIAPQKSGIEYRITVAASGYATKSYQKISVEGSGSGSVKIPTIALAPADVSVSGQVVYADGNPAARIPIFLGSRRDAPQPSRTTATDENGRFVINRVCKGPLTLQANFNSSPGGSGNLEAEGGDQDVKIVLGQGPQTRRTSLVGKPLPDLTDFGLRSVSSLAGGKQVLVCFWDVNQRPSRNCVQQLNRRAKSLAGKNVYVVLAQTPAVPDRMMVNWLRKYKVTFPVGRIMTGPEGLSKTWGVQSLPWLILTDQQHIVTAEGFVLDELNEKIKEANHAKQY